MDKEVLKLLGGISMVIGVLLLVWGLVAQQSGWPDPLNGIYSGISTLTLGLIARLISRFKKE